MAGFDDLIRGALVKQGDPTPQRRDAIYQSSRQALERMLTQNSSLDAATVNEQRQRLEEAIATIEKDYSSVPPADPSAPAPVTPPPPQIPTAAAVVQPTIPAASVAKAPIIPPIPKPPVVRAPEVKAAVRVQAAPMPAAAPQAPKIPAAAPVVLPDHLEPEIAADSSINRNNSVPPPPMESYKGDALKEKKPYARLLLWTIILVGLAVAAWWAITFGPALLKKQFDGSVPNPSRIESGSFVPDGGEGWISAFAPLDDSQNIDASGRGTADLFQDGNTNFVRLASNPGSTGNTLRIKIPLGIMETIKGRAATFEVIIKNASDKVHQFAIFCEFAEMGTCGRKRFKVGKKVESYIFDALINDVDLPQGKDAYLAINTDLSSQGKAIDLLAIRVRTGQ